MRARSCTMKSRVGKSVPEISLSPDVCTASPAPALARSLPLVEEITRGPEAWELFSRVAGLPYAIFFDSASRHPTLGRYSFIAADPFAWLRSRGKTIHIDGQASAQLQGDPFSLLAEHLARFRQGQVQGLPPFQGGAAGLFGYHLFHRLERLPP